MASTMKLAAGTIDDDDTLDFGDYAVTNLHGDNEYGTNLREEQAPTTNDEDEEGFLYS